MHFFERAVRVPLIVHAPGRFARREVGVPVSLVDLLPTVVELGRPASGAAELQGDGQSLLPLLEGAVERCVLAEYLAEGALAPIFMIRRGAQKFIWSEPDPPLLFDLDQDPDELDNLADQPAHAARVQAFAAEVRERWDPEALYQAIVASQRTRRIAFEARAAAAGRLGNGPLRCTGVRGRRCRPERARAQSPLSTPGVGPRASGAGAARQPAAPLRRVSRWPFALSQRRCASNSGRIWPTSRQKGALVRLPQMAELVRDHVLEHRRRREDQAPVQVDRPWRCSCPTGASVPSPVRRRAADRSAVRGARHIPEHRSGPTT